jgi:hypothetical protein
MEFMRWWLTGRWPDEQMAPNALRGKLERVRASRIAASGRKHGQDERIDALEREVLALEAGFAGIARLLRDKGIVTVEELERAVADHVTDMEQRPTGKESGAVAARPPRRGARTESRADQRRRPGR